MRVFAFDTAMSGCSAAFYNGSAYFSESATMDRGQAEQLVPMLGRVLGKAGAGYKDIEKIVITVGPGAFTGLRIGLSTARALGLALDIPVVGVRTLDVIARKFLKENELKEDETLCVLLETRRRDFYVQIGNSDVESLEGEEIAQSLSGKKVIFIGDALIRFRQLCPGQGGSYIQGYELPDPCLMAEMGAAGAPLLAPEPIYLRGADVSQSTKGPKIILERGDL